MSRRASRRAPRPPPCADMGSAVVGAIGARTTRLISLVLLRLAHPNSLVLFFSSLFFFLPFLFSIFIDPHFSGLLHVPGISATQASCGKINRIVQNQHLCSPPLQVCRWAMVSQTTIFHGLFHCIMHTSRFLQNSRMRPISKPAFRPSLEVAN